MPNCSWRTVSETLPLTGTRNGQLWFFTQVRLALALVIIRNKPAAMNARSYTEALAQNLQKQEQSWREKAEGLQQEVLRLRQEVVLAQVGTVPNSNSSTEQGTDRAKGFKALIHKQMNIYLSHIGSEFKLS